MKTLILVFCLIGIVAIGGKAYYDGLNYRAHRQAEQRYRAEKVSQAFQDGYHQCQQDRNPTKRQRKLPK